MRETYIIQQQPGDVLKIIDVVLVHRHSDGHGKLVTYEQAQSPDGAVEAVAGPALVMDLGRGAIYAYLYGVKPQTPLAFIKGFKRLLGDQCSVTQEVIAHPVLDDPVDELEEIGPGEDLAAAHCHTLYREPAQLLEKLKPSLFRKIR